MFIPLLRMTTSFLSQDLGGVGANLTLVRDGLLDPRAPEPPPSGKEMEGERG